MTIQHNTIEGEKINARGTGNVITVNFRQDTLFAVDRDDGVFVAVKPICDSLGLTWQGQHQRIKDDPVLSEGITTIVIPSPGGAQETTCLKLEMVNGWLFKVDSRRVKEEETRRKLLTYQRECYQVLFEAFYGKRQATVEVPDVDEVPDLIMKIRMVNACRPIFGNQAAGQLWFNLGLPIMPAMHPDPRQLTIFDYERIKVEGGAA